jgi:hypothetical protein
MKPWTTTAAVVILLAATALAQAPVPIVERIITQGTVSTRVSLFSNRTVVVSIREAGIQGFFRLYELPEDAYLAYLTSFVTNAEILEAKPISSDVDTSSSEVDLTIHVGPENPRRFRFSPMAGVSLPLSKIMGAINDIEQQARDASPSAYELKDWTPEPGQRVQLMNGEYARVVEVWEDGLLVLEYEDTFIREMVPPDQYDSVILHLVDPEP